MSAPWKEDPESKAGEPLFVVGVWRSGTSLLYALLNRHPQIGLMYEGELALLWPLFHWRRGKQWLERWDLWNRAPSRHGLDGNVLPNQVPDLRQACDLAYRTVSSKKGAHFRGEKFPSYHDRLPVLAELFPQAKFVLIWRSPLGICDSIARAGKTSSWNRKLGVLHRALFGCEQMLLGCRQLKALRIPVHHLTYQALVDDAESELRKVCAFLDLNFETEMTNLAGADRSAAYTSVHHNSVHSDRIHQARTVSDALDPKFRRKIERYITRWRRVYGVEWLADDGGATSGDEPGALELLGDKVFYEVLRLYDAVVVTAFCFAPLNWWKGYRDWKKKEKG